MCWNGFFSGQHCLAQFLLAVLILGSLQRPVVIGKRSSVVLCFTRFQSTDNRSITMASWQEYVTEDLLGSQQFCEACIIGLNDFSTWAKSANLDLGHAEANIILTAMENPFDSELREVTLAGKPFVGFLA